MKAAQPGVGGGLPLGSGQNVGSHSPQHQQMHSGKFANFCLMHSLDPSRRGTCGIAINHRHSSQSASVKKINNKINTCSLIYSLQGAMLMDQVAGHRHISYLLDIVQHRQVRPSQSCLRVSDICKAANRKLPELTSYPPPPHHRIKSSSTSPLEAGAPELGRS